MMAGSNIVCDIDGWHQGTAYGGIGNIHQLAAYSGLIKEIDNRIQLIKRYLPYHESDHILNIALKIADRIDASGWQPLNKQPKYEIKTWPRRKPHNVKQQIVEECGFEKIVTKAEDIAECEYRPGKCEKTYRLIILRKTFDVVKGTMNLFEDVRYFFYIINDRNRSSTEIVRFYRNRSDHKNDIEQLKNGVNALTPSSDTLLSNWALMVIASLAWDLKAWFGLLLSYRPLGLSIVRMEFKRFLNTFIRIPCLIVKTGRRIYYRLVGYNDKLKHVIGFSERIKALDFP